MRSLALMIIQRFRFVSFRVFLHNSVASARLFEYAEAVKNLWSLFCKCVMKQVRSMRALFLFLRWFETCRIWRQTDDWHYDLHPHPLNPKISVTSWKSEFETIYFSSCILIGKGASAAKYTDQLELPNHFPLLLRSVDNIKAILTSRYYSFFIATLEKLTLIPQG